MIFLDSTFLIKLIRKNSHIIEILKSFKDYPLVTSVINVYEVWFGFYKNKQIIEDQNYRKVIEKRINSVFNSISILDLNELNAKISAEIGGSLIMNGTDIGDKDTIITGIMKSKGIKHILTSNVNHFNRIDEILVLNESDSVKTILSKLYYSK